MESCDCALSEEQQAFVCGVAEREDYQGNPVPGDIVALLPHDFAAEVAVGGPERGQLRGIYGVESLDQAVAMVALDWAFARECGALRHIVSNKGVEQVRFPLREITTTGDPVEAGLRRRKPGEERPWCLCFVPALADCPVLLRDADALAAPKVPVVPAARLVLSEEERAFVKAVAERPEYADCPMPDDLHDGLPRDFAAEVELNGAMAGILRRIYDVDADAAAAMLAADWDCAHECGALRCDETAQGVEQVFFPLREITATGEPVEANIRRNGPDAHPRWRVSVPQPTARPPLRREAAGEPSAPARAGAAAPRNAPFAFSAARSELEEWAWMGPWNETLRKLADDALDERWDFDLPSGAAPRYVILKSYLRYTFQQLKQQGKVVEDPATGFAAFNTGLVTGDYADIYACFKRNPVPGKQPWALQGFSEMETRGLGRRLQSLQRLGSLDRADYFRPGHLEDLLFNVDLEIELNYDHILIDNVDRLPQEFLGRNLYGNAEVLGIAEDAFALRHEGDGVGAGEAFERLRDAIRTNRTDVSLPLRQALDNAVEVAVKRAKWNYRTAVPSWYPTTGKMNQLLPLNLTRAGSGPDVALACVLDDAGDRYWGATILTMDMAYKNARLIGRLESEWLHAGLPAAETPDGDEDDVVPAGVQGARGAGGAADDGDARDDGVAGCADGAVVPDGALRPGVVPAVDGGVAGADYPEDVSDDDVDADAPNCADLIVGLAAARPTPEAQPGSMSAADPVENGEVFDDRLRPWLAVRIADGLGRALKVKQIEKYAFFDSELPPNTSVSGLYKTVPLVENQKELGICLGGLTRGDIEGAKGNKRRNRQRDLPCEYEASSYAEALKRIGRLYAKYDSLAEAVDLIAEDLDQGPDGEWGWWWWPRIHVEEIEDELEKLIQVEPSEADFDRLVDVLASYFDRENPKDRETRSNESVLYFSTVRQAIETMRGDPNNASLKRAAMGYLLNPNRTVSGSSEDWHELFTCCLEDCDYECAYGVASRALGEFPRDCDLLSDVILAICKGGAELYKGKRYVNRALREPKKSWEGYLPVSIAMFYRTWAMVSKGDLRGTRALEGVDILRDCRKENLSFARDERLYKEEALLLEIADKRDDARTVLEDVIDGRTAVPAAPRCCRLYLEDFLSSMKGGSQVDYFRRVVFVCEEGLRTVALERPSVMDSEISDRIYFQYRRACASDALHVLRVRDIDARDVLDCYREAYKDCTEPNDRDFIRGRFEYIKRRHPEVGDRRLEG